MCDDGLTMVSGNQVRGGRVRNFVSVWLLVGFTVVAASGCSGTPTSPSTTTTPTTTAAGTVTIAATNSSSAPVLLQRADLAPCNSLATPLPGWNNCTGTVTLTVKQVPSSGYFSVHFNYPTSDSFYQGQVAVSTPGSYTVSVTNAYEPVCLTTSYTTTIYIYDGPTTNVNAPLIAYGVLTFPPPNCP